MTMTRNEEIRQEALKWKIDDNEFIAQTAFEGGAKWADEHPKSPWIPIDGKHPLPEIGEKVLLYYPVKDGGLYLSERMSVKRANDLVYAGGYDEYGFPVMTENAMEATLKLFRVRATYWMPIPEPNEKGGEV